MQFFEILEDIKTYYSALVIDHSGCDARDEGDVDEHSEHFL